MATMGADLELGVDLEGHGGREGVDGASEGERLPRLRRAARGGCRKGGRAVQEGRAVQGGANYAGARRSGELGSRRPASAEERGAGGAWPAAADMQPTRVEERRGGCARPPRSARAEQHAGAGARRRGGARREKQRKEMRLTRKKRRE